MVVDKDRGRIYPELSWNATFSLGIVPSDGPDLETEDLTNFVVPYSAADRNWAVAWIQWDSAGYSCRSAVGPSSHVPSSLQLSACGLLKGRKKQN